MEFLKGFNINTFMYVVKSLEKVKTRSNILYLYVMSSFKKGMGSR